MNNSLSDLQAATRRTVLEQPGTTDPALRQQLAAGSAPPELATLVRKIRDHAYKVTDRDLDDLRTRYSEDQLFEIVLATTIGAAEARLKAALAALEEA